MRGKGEERGGREKERLKEVGGNRKMKSNREEEVEGKGLGNGGVIGREKGKGGGGGEKRGGRERGMWGRTACGCLSS